MDLFLTLLSNIAPLYIIIALGWIAGRFYEVDRGSLASLAIYIIVPVVSFYYVSSLEFKAAYIALPLVVYSTFSFVTLLFYRIGRSVYADKRANLLAMCASASNTGYLGLPIVILLFPPEWVGVYVFALSGGLLYEATIMYYIANRGNFSPRASVIRVLQFPVLYAIFAGLLVNYTGFELPAQLDAFWTYFKGAYVVIGMMIVGCSLSKVSKLVISPKFLALTFAGQFVLWPLIAFALIAIDNAALHLFDPQVHKMFMIMAIVPPAANIAAFAAKLDLNPEKAATTVLMGTIFALFYIPAVLVISGLH